ncbi:MAG: dihydroneopterin aldolase [Candidatus Nanopelagicales bacterium]
MSGAPVELPGPALDRITLRGVRGRGRHGVFDFERREGQEFLVDAVLWVPTAEAARTDDLAQTVDYGAAAQLIVGAIEGEPCQLIERLAVIIAEQLLQYELVRRVEVTVHKPSAPIPVPFGDVAVTVSRAK